MGGWRDWKMPLCPECEDAGLWRTDFKDGVAWEFMCIECGGVFTLEDERLYEQRDRFSTPAREKLEELHG